MDEITLPRGWLMYQEGGGWRLRTPSGLESVLLPNRWFAIQMYLTRIPFMSDNVEHWLNADHQDESLWIRDPEEVPSA